MMIVLAPILMSVMALITPTLITYHYMKKPIKSEHLKVLLVDDEPKSLLLLQHLLRKRNIEFKVIRDPRTAIAELSHEVFDLLLLDFTMPEMSGLQLLREAEQNIKEDKCTPVVFFSGNDIEYQYLEPMKHFTMLDIWNKNLPPSRLLRKIDHLGSN
jgi:CheY-like chemotaxis protein